MNKISLKRYIEDLAPKTARLTACDIIDSYQDKSTGKNCFYFNNTAVDFLSAILYVVLCDYATPFDEEGNELKPVVTKDNCIIPFAYDKEDEIVEPFMWKPGWANENVAVLLNKPLEDIISIISKDKKFIGCNYIIRAFENNAIEQLQQVVDFLKDIFKSEE